MNPSEEQVMKGYAESLEIQLNESLGNLQGERRLNAVRMLKLLEWYSNSLDELQTKVNLQNIEIQNLKELLEA